MQRRVQRRQPGRFVVSDPTHGCSNSSGSLPSAKASSYAARHRIVVGDLCLSGYTVRWQLGPGVARILHRLHLCH